MKVQLYVYDLSRGLARQMSQQFLGTHIEAVYHTSLVFGGIEYYFGASIQTSYPGSTHHGQPMEVITMGTTELPLELILEYMDSLRSVYSAESYDLFLHNCNNFTNDFAMFLVGKGIPDHITSLPRRVLDTPFGQMLRPQLDSAMRGITQSSSAPLPGAQMNGAPKPPTQGTVKNITRLSELTSLLQSAPAAVLFFTSATCPPCKICYPIYDTLAADYPTQIALIKIDTSAGYEIAKQYGIRATPTFITYLKGEKFEEWSGADASRLESTIRLLVQMSAAPVHRHRNLRLPTLQRKQKPITFTKMPPLEKLLGKLDPKVASSVEVQGLKDFISSNPKINSQSKGNSGPPALPDLPALSTFILSLLDTTPLEKLFPLIDLLRLAVLDRRVASFFLLASKDASK